MRGLRVHSRRQRPRAGFSLIEMLAVVLILGLMATLLGPPLGLRSGRAVEEAGELLSSALEFARQRAVMTGRAHRLVISLDWVHYPYRVEWVAPEPIELQRVAFDPRAPIELSAPADAGESFSPVPGPLGRENRLPEGVYVLDVELMAGRVDDGEVELRFEPDGTADAAWIRLGNEDGRPRRILELLPLADAVVLHDAES